MILSVLLGALAICSLTVDNAKVVNHCFWSLFQLLFPNGVKVCVVDVFVTAVGLAAFQVTRFVVAGIVALMAVRIVGRLCAHAPTIVG